MLTNNSPIWQELTRLAADFSTKHIRDLVSQDASRTSKFTKQACGLTLDFTRARLDSLVIDRLIELGDEVGLAQARSDMFSGARINNTENRSVLHTALRLPRSSELMVDGVDVVAQVQEVLARCFDFADEVRNGGWLGYTGERITDIVNIGIGGSDLGPVMVDSALKPYAQKGLRAHFVSNVDASDIAQTLSQVDASSTLFIVASKTFTTQETMMNANTARSWLIDQLGSEAAVAKHFVAVSTNAQKVGEFGIAEQNMFGFWDWVGGRYSTDSAIGLSNMIMLGREKFEQLLAGFHAMDEHFRTAPHHENLPVLLGLIGVWNRSLLGIESVAVLPYDQYLHRFPAYLQQLIMESNGKRVTKDGTPVEIATSAIYWGEPGTNGQHSFYQMLHQGTSQVAIDMLLTAKSHNPIGAHHQVLASNAIAQAAVFAFGRSAEEVAAAGVPSELVSHKVMPGNRPTTILAVEQITPHVLGALIALYEHMVFVQGVVWQINSFDQWGVELGKELATSILPALATDGSSAEFDRATNATIKWWRETAN